MTAREWLILATLPGLGPRRLAQLIEAAPAWPDGWLAAMPEPARSHLRLWLDHPARSPLQAQLDAALDWEAAADRHHLLTPAHDDWPALLAQIPDPPPVLWASGDLDALVPPGLAIVGSRRPSRDGLQNAQRFGRELAEQDWCVISGMALGIDGAAQQAALDAGGRSVAVLGCGVDVIYPQRHRQLYARLRDEGGLLLAEHPPGTGAHPAFFPRRNRIVTGLSQGVLVVEAAEKSGSLVSARLATEQNREVFAVPGSIHNPQARGCLALIRDGAAMATCVEDILAELGHWVAPSQALPSAAAGEQDPLLAWLSDRPTPLDALVALSGHEVSDCQLRLLELELEGLVTQAVGGWIRLPR
ncbi:DNA protecting protein DprA [Franzmannia pantelleriensis]|uniref:DNA protecting protein DprA n=1 Tax=Franzmannia pantelleriensis TaxID=48727 RepID=A0A1G9S4E1_9GAMM|nr:DNA-processing protein DprA [Halomonas pantelleriensis]SDM30177.1 DNA protecting protein DprA [Halomonas pantelleriensis]